MEFSDDTENISHLLDLAFDFRRLERTLQFQGLLQVDSMLYNAHMSAAQRALLISDFLPA